MAPPLTVVFGESINRCGADGCSAGGDSACDFHYDAPAFAGRAGCLASSSFTTCSNFKPRALSITNA